MGIRNFLIIVHCLTSWNNRNEIKVIPRRAYISHFIDISKISALLQKVLLYTINKSEITQIYLERKLPVHKKIELIIALVFLLGFYFLQ